MSKFYGTIQGNRSAATRGGSRNSGFRASAQSYDGSVITNLSYIEVEPKKEVLNIRIDLADDSRSNVGYAYFNGTMDELKECFENYRLLKEARYIDAMANGQ